MPHLSPMHWLLAILSTTMMLITMASILWWTQIPSFNKYSSKYTKKLTKWNWL